jgi:mediator of RNA polymerase II transcription subunit 18
LDETAGIALATEQVGGRSDGTRLSIPLIDMSSQFYEIALFGEFFARDLKSIMNRITLHSESSEPMHTREIVFEPIDAQLQRDSGNDPLLLRAKKELEDPDSPWCTMSSCPPALAHPHLGYSIHT